MNFHLVFTCFARETAALSCALWKIHVGLPDKLLILPPFSGEMC